MINEDPISILLVEDDPDFLALLKGMLSEEGYLVHGAASGESALVVAQENSFDLVITDVKLGGIDGLDTLAELKRDQSELQSLVITGYATEADSVRAISLGVGNYMRKPFTLPDFLRAVNQLSEEIYKERGLSNYFAFVKETILWGLEVQAKSSSQEGTTSLIDAAKKAEREAKKKGLSSASARHIRLAVLAAGVKGEGGDADVPFLFNILPDESSWLLERLEKEDTAESLEEEIATKALKGDFALAETTFDSAETDEEAAEETSDEVPQSTLSLLALARALEVSGDLKGATLVLDKVDGDKGTNSVQALLVQARVELAKGRFSEAESLLLKADTTAKDLLGQSKVKLDGGLLLKEMGKKELAQEWLETAVDGFGELSNSTESARAKLALWAVGEDPNSFQPEALSQLQSPGSLEVFLSSARWLYPYILSVPQNPVVERALQRLTRDLPQLVSSVLSTEISEPQKLVGLNIIGQVGLDGYEDALQELMLAPSPGVRKASQDLLRESRAINVAPILRLYTLGTMATWVGERKIPDKGWVGSKPGYLFAYLAQNAGQLLSQDHLIDLFWPKIARAGKNLSQCVFLIRNILRSPDWPESIDYVLRSGNQVGLNPEQTVWFDAGIVRESLDEGKKLMADGRSAKAAESLQQALELDRGSYLEASYADWALVYRDTLQRDLSQGLNTLAQIRLEQSRPEDALLVSQHILDKDPLDENASKNLFQAYLDSGQPIEVIRGFEKLERTIKLELEMEPSMDLVRLYHLAKLKL